MSLTDRTPWEMVQEFFKEFDGKNGDYSEVNLESDFKTIRLCKSTDGSVTVYDPTLEYNIERGHYSEKTRILVRGKVGYDCGVLNLVLNSASNMILSKKKHGGYSYYHFDLSHYKKNGHVLRMIAAAPGTCGMDSYVERVEYGGENSVYVQSAEPATGKNVVQVDVDMPWDLMIGYLRSSIKGHDVNKEEVNRVAFYLKNDEIDYLEKDSIQTLVMSREGDGISIVRVSNILNELFEESNIRGVRVMKENLQVGGEGERKELQIYGEPNGDETNLIYIDEYPRGERGQTMRLGFGMKYASYDHIVRVASYKIIGMEVF